jgi:MFS superfamily sulfate permease-like transporter
LYACLFRDWFSGFLQLAAHGDHGDRGDIAAGRFVAGGTGGRGRGAVSCLLAAATALLVAVIAFISWLAGAGTIVNFISESVMIGFKCGVALFLASTQLPKLCGLKGRTGISGNAAATS